MRWSLKQLKHCGEHNGGGSIYDYDFDLIAVLLGIPEGDTISGLGREILAYICLEQSVPFSNFVGKLRIGQVLRAHRLGKHQPPISRITLILQMGTIYQRCGILLNVSGDLAKKQQQKQEK